MGIVKFFVPVALLVMLLIPSCSALSTMVKKPSDLPPVWGPILKASCNAGFECYSGINSTVMAPAFSYLIVGIGDHTIVYTIRYNLSLYDGTWRNASYMLRDGLYFVVRPFCALAMLR